MSDNPTKTKPASSLTSPITSNSRKKTPKPSKEPSNVLWTIITCPFRAFGRWCYTRWCYTPLAKRYCKELIYQSIPVFLAAAFSNFIMSLIRYISEESKGDHIDNECIQTFFYSILAYLIGYYLTLELKKLINVKENQLSWVKWLEEKEYTEILFGIFAENSGFAWREFVNTFILKIIFLRYGWGPSFGAWILMLFVFILMTLGSGNYIKFKQFHKDFKDLLIEYDSDCFAFPLAFSITVLCALGFQLIGANYVDTAGYLYEWKDDDNEEESSGTNALFYLYLMILSLLVATILVIEDRFCLKCFQGIDEEIESYNPRASNISKDIIAETHHTLEGGVHGLVLNTEIEQTLEKKVVYTEWVELWHNFLGCLVGIAFYTLIVDQFLAYGDGDSVALVIIALLIAFFLSWRGPACIASAVVRQKTAQKELLRRKTNNEKAVEVSWYSSICEFYLHLKMHRRGTMIISLRLMTGWTWETAITELINLISDSETLDSGVTVAVTFSITVLAVVIAIIVQYFVRNWEIEIEDEKESSQPQVNPLQTTTQNQSAAIAPQTMERK